MVNCSINGTIILSRTSYNIKCNQLQQKISHNNIPPIPEEAKIFFICLFFAIFVLGVTGNAVVCCIIGKKKQLSGGDAFIISLACADLLLSASASMYPMSYYIWNQRWPLGSILCKIWPTIAPISLLASSWSLVLIAADRYRAVVTPMKRRWSTKSKLCIIICMWAVSIVISAPYILTKRYGKSRGEYLCVDNINAIRQKKMAIYFVMLSITGWIVPVFKTAVLYGLCIRKLQGSKLKNDNSDSMKRRIIQNQRVIRTFILIETLFCICTLPYAILYQALVVHFVYKLSSDGSYSKLLSTITLCLLALSLTNSCMNPFVYAKRQREMKVFVKKAWNIVCRKDVRSDIQTDSMNTTTQCMCR